MLMLLFENIYFFSFLKSASFLVVLFMKCFILFYFMFFYFLLRWLHLLACFISYFYKQKEVTVILSKMLQLCWQASLLSLVPSNLLNASKVSKVTANALVPLVNWVCSSIFYYLEHASLCHLLVSLLLLALAYFYSSICSSVIIFTFEARASQKDLSSQVWPLLLTLMKGLLRRQLKKC